MLGSAAHNLGILFSAFLCSEARSNWLTLVWPGFTIQMKGKMSVLLLDVCNILCEDLCNFKL